MLGHSQISFQQVNNFVHEKVNQRSAEIQKSIHAIIKLIQEILKDVEIQGRLVEFFVLTQRF